MNEINIICTHQFRELLQEHKRYEKDLGRRYTKRSNRSVEVDIRDPFVLKIYKTSEALIYKVGRLGALTLYTYDGVPADKVWVYVGDTCYEREFNALDMEMQLERYLSKLLGSVEEEVTGSNSLD